MLTNEIRWTLAIGMALVALLSGRFAQAADGAIEINQALAVLGDVTPGDAPGFPVSITRSGSYVLTGNLELSDPDADALVIELGVTDVSIDLNGFALIGPVVCTGEATSHSCTPVTAVGSGITARDFTERITVRGGSVRGFGSYGVSLPPRSAVHELRAIANQGTGITCLNRCQITDSVVSRNGSGMGLLSRGVITNNVVYGNHFDGIKVTQHAAIRSNVVSRNGRGMFAFGSNTIVGNLVTDNVGDGIVAAGDNLLNGNAVRANGGFGLKLVARDGYVNNVITGNSAGSVDGGTNLASNVCDYDIYCP